MTASTSKEENLAKAETFVCLAAERGAAFVVLPEVFAWRGPRDQEPAQLESIPGPTSERLAELARSLGVHLLAGSFLEKTTEQRAYNTSLLFSPAGEMLAQYRKIHLFDIDLPGQVTIKESDTKKTGPRHCHRHNRAGNGRPIDLLRSALSRAVPSVGRQGR
jgi:predicted amidohydrolase